jgi:hypothetical protein
VRTHSIEAERQPQLRTAITAVRDEIGELAMSDRPRRDLEWFDHDAVARCFVVERKAITGVTDCRDAAMVPMPRERPRPDGGQRPARAVYGLLRVVRQQMLDVGQDQLLMLLFVMDAERDEIARRGGDRADEEVVHRAVDVRAICEHGREIGTREQPALRPRMPLPDGVVIRVEEHSEHGVERRIPRQRRREQKCLEEPARCARCHDRTGVGHRLPGAILVRKWRSERE